MPKELDLNLLFQRNKLIWGDKTQELISSKHIIVFGLGGVGGHAAEALTRVGIGELTIIDFDKISSSNFNRQLIATLDNLDKLKTDAMTLRLKNINPNIKLNTISEFYNASLNSIIFSKPVDFVLDAIDSVNSKVDLIEYCLKNKINIISSMGTGNRFNPLDLYITDIKDTKNNNCPLLKKIKSYLKKRSITEGLTIITSKENPVKPDYKKFINPENPNSTPPGSCTFVPPVAGIIMASYAISKIIQADK